MNFLTTDIFKKIKKVEQEMSPATKTHPNCPSDEILMDYVCHDLDDNRHKDVSEHIQQCASCHVAMQEMETLRKLWEPDLKEAYQKVLKEIAFDTKAARSPAGVVRTFLNTYRFKSSLQLAYRFLNPEAASEFSGNLVPSAAPESHWKEEKETDIGQITLSGVLQDKTENAPACLGLRWGDLQDLVPGGEFDIRLVNPETQETRYEIPWKTIRQSNEIFRTKEKLGFDPFREKWEISIATYRRDAQ